MLATARRPSPLWTRSLYGLLVQYRRTWKSSVAMNFVYPVLYLTAMGLGLGGLVNRHLALTHSGALGGVDYLTFIAPGILAASGMQIAVAECTWPILGRIKWERSYLAMLQSPIRVDDILYGQLAFVVLRLATTSVVFLVVMWAYGALRSPQALLAPVFGVLVGCAFATPCMAFAATQQTDFAFSTISRMIVIPLFLFSGTFFPVAQLPRPLQVIAPLTPLYHGVELVRAATLGELASAHVAFDVAYLAALTAVGIVLARRSFARRLAQ